MVPTLVVVTPGKVIVVPPRTVLWAAGVIAAIVPSLTVTVTSTGLGGVAPSVIASGTCRSLPTLTLVTLMFGAVTVAVIDVKFDGVSNPAGCTTAITDEPDVAGSNAVFTAPIFGPNTSGLVVIVPTLGCELVTGTLTVK